MKVRYRGPGDAVELDGLSFRKGELVEVTRDQYERMVRSDPDAVVVIETERADTADDVERIRAAQTRIRERGVKAAVREADTAEEADRAASEAVPAAKKGGR